MQSLIITYPVFSHTSDAVELQLAHRIGNEAEKAYFRTELLDIRAKILTDWYDFLRGR